MPSHGLVAQAKRRFLCNVKRADLPYTPVHNKTQSHCIHSTGCQPLRVHRWHTRCLGLTPQERRRTTMHSTVHFVASRAAFWCPARHISYMADRERKCFLCVVGKTGICCFVQRNSDGFAVVQRPARRNTAIKQDGNSFCNRNCMPHGPVRLPDCRIDAVLKVERAHKLT